MSRSGYVNPIEKYSFIHHFVPHPVHKRRATLLRPLSLFIYCLVFLSVFLLAKFSTIIAPGVLGYASNIEVNALLEETNRTRLEHGLHPLTLNNSLSEAANAKAHHMFTENYWAHVSPSGVEPWDFILSADYDYIYAGENLAKNFNTSNQVVDAWYASKTHRDNLLSSNYDEIGFAIVNGELDGYQTTLVVQMFGKTKDSVTAPIPEEYASLQNAPANNVSSVNLNVSRNNLNLDTAPTVASLDNTMVVNVASVSRGLLGLYIAFMFILLSLDIWYTRKHSIKSLSGNAFAHILFLFIILGSVWLVMSPGRIL